MSVFSFYKNMLYYQKRYPFLLILLLLSIAMSILYEITVPLVFKWMFDEIFHQHNLTQLINAIWILGISLIILILASLMQSYAASLLSAKVIAHLRFKLFSKMQKITTLSESKQYESDMIFRFTNDLTLVESISVYLMWSGFTALCTGIVGTLLLLYFDWVMTFTVAIIIPFLLILPRKLSDQANHFMISKKAVEKQLLADFQEALTLQDVIRLFMLRMYKIRQFKTKLYDLIRTSNQYNLYTVLSGRISYFDLSFIRILVLCMGGYFVVQGQLSIGKLVGFIILLGTITSSINSLLNLFPLLKRSAESIEKIKSFIEVSQAKKIKPLQNISPFLKRIRFANVSLKKQNKEILHNIDININKGMFIAFVGPSGAGKTSLLKLLLKEQEATRGTIYFDDIDYQNITTHFLLTQMSVVMQESKLFETTIFENIRMGHLVATQAEIEAAAKSAGIHDDIMQLPDGYLTEVGKSNSGLSLGQAQRIAIARALLSKPAILCLDEATSALDPFNSTLIDETLQKLARKHTIISITHRLSSVVKADMIVVLEKGCIVDIGTHYDLMTKEGLYKQLWEKQHGFILNQKTHAINIIPQWLRHISLFEELDDNTLNVLADGFVIENYQAGVVVFKENEPADKFYVLVAGTVNVIQTENGEEKITAKLTDGDYFGEIALLYDSPRNATIKTETVSIFLTLHYRVFYHVMLLLPPHVRSSLIKKAIERFSKHQKNLNMNPIRFDSKKT